MLVSNKHIAHINRIQQVLQYANNEYPLLFFFDIDRTLIIPSDYEYLEAVITKKILLAIMRGNISNIFEKSFLQYLQTNVIPSKVIEHEIHTIIQKLIELHPCLGITSRFPSLALHTIQDLHSKNIYFSTVYNDYTFHDSRYSYALIDGILFCGTKNNKGTLLEKFYATLTDKPQKLIVVDDDRANLEAIAYRCTKIPVAFQGLHYTYLEPRSDTKRRALFMKAMAVM